MKGRKMNRALVLVSVIVSALVLGVTSSALAECITDACHQDMGTKAYVHGPVGAGQCAICHESSSANHPSGSGPDFTLAFQGGKELCFGCHERMDQNPVVHKPVELGDCIACHDPHQSEIPYILLEKPQQICIPCHTDPKVMELAAHKQPGECLSCHNPHLGKNRLLLTKDYKEVKQPVGSVPGLPEFQAVPEGLPIEGSTTK